MLFNNTLVASSLLAVSAHAMAIDHRPNTMDYHI
jgi:hypothetical protein